MLVTTVGTMWSTEFINQFMENHNFGLGLSKWDPLL